MCAYDSTKPVTGGSLVAADMRENFRALKEDDIVEGVAALGITEGMLAASAVAQAKLKTSQGSVNHAGDSLSVQTLPGGEYGFYRQIKANAIYQTGEIADLIVGAGTTTSYVTSICLHPHDAARTLYVQQRYVTASGEIFWIFILRDKITKQIISMYQAPDHPCFGNGGKPLLRSHPFLSYEADKHEIIVINPTNDELQEMRVKTIQSENKPDKDLLDVIAEDYEIDEMSNPQWPTKEVTVGLPPDWDEAWLSRIPVQPIKKVIPKANYILCKKLKLK
ncbi:MAG: hypothetical protein ABID54_00105 [Pseudomonadota bacterium]